MSPFDEVGDRVFRRRYASLDLNIGVIMGEAGIAIVDTRASHRQADELRAELAQLTTSPIVAVINTHYHWDHVWGNARFPAVPIWGHVRCKEFLESDGNQMIDDALGWMPKEHHDEIRAVVTTPPTHVFEAVARLDLGDREIWLSYHGRAHTDSDIVIRVPDAEVTFLGDLIEEGAPPQFGSSFPLDWPPTIQAIERNLARTIVPGHGDVVDAAFVAAQREELAAVAAALAGHGAARDEAPAGPYPERFMRQAFNRYRELLRLQMERGL
ncbi:MAG: MBL fold metallo-hydrolase [Acidimicrobiia bacterium]|nr:MBL fold metallo-hydrolase [Acidimicrobiia bacterium]